MREMTARQNRKESLLNDPICWMNNLLGRFLKSYPLRIQIIISFALLTIFSVTAVGLTALQTNYRYLEQQKRLQSSALIQEFYKSQESEIANMAVLAASRPSLAHYLRGKDTQGLQTYLIGLKAGMPHIDTITACDRTGQMVVVTEGEPTAASCTLESNPHYTVLYHDGVPEAWLLRGRKVFDQNDEVGTVVLGVQLDDELLMEMCTQCNLYHTIINNGEVIASSFGPRYAQRSEVRVMPLRLADAQFQESFFIDDHEYYISHHALNGSGMDVEVALDVTSIHLDHRQQEFFLTIVIIVVVLIAIFFGAFLAQCIQQPLAKLVAATNPSRNLDLSNPIEVDTKLREVVELTQVLEDARGRISTALTSLQKEKEWSDLLLESIVEGIIILNHASQIAYFSPGAERITGWTQGEVLWQPVDGVLKSAAHKIGFVALLPPAGEKLRSSFLMRDDKKKILAITHARLPARQVENGATVLVLRDVSEEEALSHLLGNFLGNITHEFRTPLTALAASIEILLEEADNLQQAEIKELLRSIHLSTLNLEHLIDNLLEGSSIESGRFNVKAHPTELRSVLRSAIETIDPLLVKYGQTLRTDLPETLPLVQIDARRINQVLLNLLSNASKYGPVDGEIFLSARHKGGFVEVAVADQGPGIPPAFREEIFSGYVMHVNEVSRHRKGAGLGLSVINAIVKAHGGQVGVRDHASGGAEFWFTVPVTGDE